MVREFQFDSKLLGIKKMLDDVQNEPIYAREIRSNLVLDHEFFDLENADVTNFPPENRSFKEMLVARTYLNRGDLANAYAHADAATREEIVVPGAYGVLGEILTKQGNIALAINKYELECKIKGDTSEVYNNLGVLHFDVGEFNLAHNNFNKSVRLDPHNVVPMYGLLWLNVINGEFGLALNLAAKSKEVNPTGIGTWTLSGQINAALGKKNQARADLGVAVQNNPKTYNDYMHRARAFAYLGLHEKAVNDINRAAILNGSSLALNVLAQEVYLLKQDFEQAGNIYDSMRKLYAGKRVKTVSDYLLMLVATDKFAKEATRKVIASEKAELAAENSEGEFAVNGLNFLDKAKVFGGSSITSKMVDNYLKMYSYG
jgi:tetratricopeptide (TPR) repeat protein